MGKYEGMRKLERSRHRWENNIKVGLKEIRYEDMDSIDSEQGQLKGCQAVMKTVMKSELRK